MPSSPRIRRARIDGAVVTAPEPVPVTARLIWPSGTPTITDVPALAVAWTSTAVLVRWYLPPVSMEPGVLREDWVTASTISRRLDGAPLETDGLRHEPMPPELDLFYVPPA